LDFDFSCSAFYKKDVEGITARILDVVGTHAQSIIALTKEFKVPMKLGSIISLLLETGFSTIYLVFNEVLEILGVKGLYTIDDLGFNIDEHDLWFHCCALKGCNLQVDDFFIHLEPGGETLTTYSYIEIKNASKEELKKLKNLIRQIEAPEEFDEVDSFEATIEEAEGLLTLRIDLIAESIVYLPKINEISRFAKQTFEQVGIKQ